MSRFKPSRAQIGAFIAALLVLNIIGVIISTQFNIGHLLRLGVDVPFSVRLSTTLHDIISMQPLFILIFGTGMLIAMAVATLIAKWVKILPDLVYTLAGLACMVVIFIALKAALQITAIGATREWDGFLSLCLVGGLAGYVYSVAMTRLESRFAVSSQS